MNGCNVGYISTRQEKTMAVDMNAYSLFSNKPNFSWEEEFWKYFINIF
jgi:hypothetical protein